MTRTIILLRLRRYSTGLVLNGVEAVQTVADAAVHLLSVQHSIFFHGMAMTFGRILVPFYL